VAAGIYGAVVWILGVRHGLPWIVLSVTSGAGVTTTVAALLLLWPFAASACLVVGGLMLLRRGDSVRPLVVGGWLAVPLLPVDMLLRPSLGGVLFGSFPTVVVLPMTAAAVGVLVFSRRTAASA
jgi:hypothetical protein